MIELSRGIARANFLFDGAVIPCATAGATWNGWGCPYFTKEQAEKLATIINEMPGQCRFVGGGSLKYDEARDAFISCTNDEGDEEVFEVVTAALDGNEIKVYAIGAFSWTWDPVSRLPSVEQSISAMKAQLVGMVESGLIPVDVSSFSELHDYIDANCLGGFCDNDFAENMCAYYGGRDENEGMPDELMDYMNAAQDSIDAWVRNGEMRQAISLAPTPA